MISAAKIDHANSGRRLPARRAEGGWVLAATLVLSTLAVAVTVTYARHAVLAKKSLEFAKGASEVEEATRSGLQRVRERMRRGDSPGTLAEGTADQVVTSTGQTVVGEREEITHNTREVRVRAESTESGEDEEAHIRARAEVAPGSGETQKPTQLRCEDGQALLLAGNLTIIDGHESFSDIELAGLFLLEEGATLDLHNVILRGTIITRAGICASNPKLVGSGRPSVNVTGGLRLLAGTELPDTAMVAPDLRFLADETSAVEVRGFAVADEVEVSGRGCMRGMIVSGASEVIGTDVRRPGHGRLPEDFPTNVECGGEVITRMGFPTDVIPDVVLDTMADAEIP
ncbi:MAG TPA: hypothetical protein VK824_08530 [Planctomycetota bacterium]|nr:hypothetical protein [Planctomycetota bacterium]